MLKSKTVTNYIISSRERGSFLTNIIKIHLVNVVNIHTTVDMNLSQVSPIYTYELDRKMKDTILRTNNTITDIQLHLTLNNCFISP